MGEENELSASFNQRERKTSRLAYELSQNKYNIYNKGVSNF